MIKFLVFKWWLLKKKSNLSIITENSFYYSKYKSKIWIYLEVYTNQPLSIIIWITNPTLYYDIFNKIRWKKANILKFIYFLRLESRIYKHKYSNPFRVDVFMIMTSQAFKKYTRKRKQNSVKKIISIITLQICHRLRWSEDSERSLV